MKMDQKLRSLAPPRVGPFREGVFDSPLHEERTAAWLGVALGIAFSVCFLTGLISHGIQHPPGWLQWFPRPSWLYRLSQGIHVTTGIASVPLLLGKLWTVYPRLWAWPPLESVANAVERLSLLPLVGGSLFLLFSGVASISRWLPFSASISFPPAHYAAAWITIGGLVVHVGAKIGATRTALSRGARPGDGTAPMPPIARGLSRRGFLGSIAGAAVTLAAVTVGQTLRPLAWAGALAPRDPRVGPQGVPVNKTAAAARVSTLATDPAYELVVEGSVPSPLRLSLADLRAMPQREARLPIACVDGWSAMATWRGVPVRDVIAAAGGSVDAEASVASLQRAGAPYASSDLDAGQIADQDTLLALELNGEPLALDHGYPVRLIGPNRPGVQQTKWLAKVVVR
ncbi:MAG: molybdopterin-dependent oxidoreductase [Actinomycetota bacterium]